MGLETTTTIEGLNSSWPLSSDSRIQGDDHVRQIKDVLKRTFPGAGGNGFNTAISASETELNYVDGVTGPIQEQLDAKAPLASPALTGTPTVPTPTTGNNSQQIPNTSWVNAAIAANTPGMRLAAKAFVHCGVSGNIYASYNVASVTDLGTGKIRVVFTTPFSSSNYVVVGTTEGGGSAGHICTVDNSTPRGPYRVDLYNVQTGHIDDNIADPVSWSVVVFGDQ